jgi:glycosyltransferase involved in cell wall biosynthesis
MIQSTYIKDNKLITMFDLVRFFTSMKDNIFTLDLIEGIDDYRVILTHGVIGELINVIENNYYGLDKNKLVFLCNNIETTKLCQKHKLTAYQISEYIFSNDDLYNIIDTPKIFDCVFPGRESKTIGIFQNEYNVNLLKCYTQPNFPFSRNEMVYYFNSSKCGLMTTESEGSCLSVGEMLLCGIPVVSVKINTNPPYPYYPINNHNYKNTYDIVLPNTLGGRELWLNENNSVYCDRNDNSIEEAINIIINKNFDKHLIRNDFLSKLSFQRYQFLYLLESILNELKMSNVDLNNFINLPYGNSSINTTQWNSIKQHFLTSFS